MRKVILIAAGALAKIAFIFRYVNEKLIFTSVSYRFPYLVGLSWKARVSDHLATCAARAYNEHKTTISVNRSPSRFSVSRQIVFHIVSERFVPWVPEATRLLNPAGQTSPVFGRPDLASELPLVPRVSDLGEQVEKIFWFTLSDLILEFQFCRLVFGNKKKDFVLS